MSSSFNSHEAFEAVIRKYGHPAAVADLDAFQRGGSSWRRFLEALATTCRDNAIQCSVDAKMKETPQSDHVDDECLLFRAMVDMCGPRMADNLSEDTCQKLREQLASYGRPLPQKNQMIAEHNARVYYHELAIAREQAQGMTHFRQTSSSIRKDVKSSTSTVDWSQLSKIAIRDLKLYASTEGKYIEGKLLVDPFTPMVGTTTILEDGNGDVTLLALYNFLPDGLHGKESIPVASAMVPKGGTVRIAAPFVKVFRDGGRGIRVDDPNDIALITGGGASMSENDSLANAKALGNSLVKKKMFNAASDAYINGLRKADLVPTLLSNRSQTYAMVGDWERSLADAAASLVIRPGNKKTWARYEMALSKMPSEQSDGRHAAHEILSSVLLSKTVDQAVEPSCNVTDAFELKRKGNDSFRRKAYAEAAGYYTSALEVCTGVTCALLTNWALCCLHTGANIDAVAACAASLRLQPGAKAVCRLAAGLLSLGEPELCCNVVREKYYEVIEGSALTGERDELVRCSEEAFPFLKANENLGISLLEEPKYLPQWIGDIETFDAGSKGRGVRAKVDLKVGQIVLIEPPLASADVENIDGMVFNVGNTEVRQSSDEYIRQAIIMRSQRDAVLSNIVDSLYDGTAQRPVVALEKLVPNLGSCQALLPSHYEYVPGERVQLSADRIGSIVSINSHGNSTERWNTDSFTPSNSSLFPAVSMFNHSNEPTCAHSSIGGCMVVSVIRSDVKAGSELTLRYHGDDEVVRKKWGISS